MTSTTPNQITNVIVTGKSGAGKQPRIDVLMAEFDLDQLSTGNIFRYFLGKFNDYDYQKSLDQFWDEEKNDFIADEHIIKEIGTDDEDIILGLKAKYFVDKGLFGPDQIVNALFESAFAEKHYQNQVLDGYPRTIEQSRFLLKLLDEQDSTVDFIVWVENSDERIVKRTVNRRICPNCGKVYHLIYNPPPQGKCKECNVDVVQRSDDTEEKIRSRLEEFHQKTVPAINHLKEHGIPIIKVPGHLEEFTKENVRKSVMDQIEQLYA